MHIAQAHYRKEPPPYLHGRDRKTGAQIAGLAYEARAQEHLLLAYGDQYIPSPWFEYRIEGTVRPLWCQMDGLLVDLDRGKIVVTEIKIRHTQRAVEQLFGKYLPVLAAVFPPVLWALCAVEIVRYFDPSERVSKPVVHRSMPDEASKGDFNVVTFRGRS